MFSFLPRLSFRGLLLMALGLIGVALVAIALTIVALRNDAIDDAVNDTNNLATVLAEQTARAVQAIDIATSEIAERIGCKRANFRTSITTRSFAARPPTSICWNGWRGCRRPKSLRLIDKDGASSMRRAAGRPNSVDFSDRDYFIHARDHPESKLFVSDVMHNRVSGQPNIFFAKRIDGSDGELPRCRACRRKALIFPAHLSVADLVAAAVLRAAA